MTATNSRALALVTLATLLSSALPAAAGPENWRLAGESTTLYFNQHVLSDLGLEIIGASGQKAGHFEYLELEAVRSAPTLEVEMPQGSFRKLISGSLRHRGGFDVRWEGGFVPLQELEIHPSPVLYTFELRGGDGSAVFVLDYPHARYIPEARRMVFVNMDLRIARELADRLGRPELEGLAVGEGHVITAVVEGEILPQGVTCEPDFSGEIDVQLTRVDYLSEIFHTSERVAMAPSAELANVGTADIEWFQSIAPDSYGGQSTLGQHPYLVMHLYRLADGVLQQIGRSDLKHAFFSANQDCPCPADQVLYEGCSDLYGTGTNAWRSRLAPRAELTAATGDWVSLGSHFDGEPVDDYRDHDEEHHPDPFEHRLTASVADLVTPGASYFVEAWYIVKGDIDIFNSMGYRGISPQAGSPWTFPFTDSALTQGSVVDAWIDPASPPPGASTAVVETEAGHLKLAVQASQLEDGFHHYELALMNLDFDRRLRSLSVTLPPGAVVRSPGFDDLDDDDNNDWQLTVADGTATWATVEDASETNALDWGTLFNFRFDTNAAPVDGQLSLGVLEPGEPSTLEVAAKIPGPSALALHRISLLREGSGAAASEPGGIDCGLDCQEDFVDGIELRLTAAAEPGHHLLHWQEGGATLTESLSYSFPVTSERQLSVVFEPCTGERLLGPAEVEIEAVYETCETLVAGNGFQVSGSEADVTFRAGESIVLGDGFVVGSGARFRAVLDARLVAAQASTGGPGDPASAW